jgi:hypothetical protein
MEAHEFWDSLAFFSLPASRLIDIVFYELIEPAVLPDCYVVIRIEADEIGMWPEGPTDRSPAAWWGDGPAFIYERLLSSFVSQAAGAEAEAESRPADRGHRATGTGSGTLPCPRALTTSTFSFAPSRVRPWRGCRYVLARRDPCDHHDTNYLGVASVS